ncbi:MAG: hypothetical protein HON90_02240 [Halobacteriovoraceae bacterium]|jgi:hypothetical protein|nr:hypothetical protein [Halobacteriovoraceae bacterium]
MKISFHKLICILFCVIISCAKTDEAEVISALQEAKYFLSSMECTDALSALDEIGFQEDNADYISVYASAQACKAGYKELDLFGGNLDSLASASLITSLAALSSSNETEPDSANFLALDGAITTLLSYDGTAQPNTAARNIKFGTKKSGDISLQALYLLFVQMGKFYALYGNAGINTTPDPDVPGSKGYGTFTNSCLFSYTTSDAIDWVTASPAGTCTAATGSEGSDFLESPVTAAVIKTRLCNGIIYYNNLMDILANVTLPGSDSLGDVGNIQTVLANLMSLAELAEAGAFNDGDANGVNAISALKSVTGQAACEAENIERIEKFYAIFLETIYQ